MSNSSRRLSKLLSNGYFPAELPPVFTSANFGTNASKFKNSWQRERLFNFKTRPDIYNIPHHIHVRRKLSIVNPVNQLAIADIIAENWPAIRKLLKRTRSSEFDPRITSDKTSRAITGVNFEGVAKRKAEILSSYGNYIKTDISRFYASIYTHSIAWAISGKDFCKKNRHTDSFKKGYANQLDRAIRAGQDDQTMGIPIGPDTSRIISELIAVGIEAIIKSNLKEWNNRTVRYVDDMIIGFSETESPSQIISTITSALYEYELDLNSNKTSIHGVGFDHIPEWIHYIRNFGITDNPEKQQDDLDSYFSQAIHLADKNSNENVLLFACKRISNFEIDEKHKSHLIRWLLYITRRAPSCLSFVAEYLSSRELSTEQKKEISKYITHQIPIKSASSHIHEASWLLFLAKELEIIIPSRALKQTFKLNSSTLALLITDLRRMGLIKGSIDTSFWKRSATADGLKSEMWLAIYEITKNEWWPQKISKQFIKDNPFFGDMLDHGIYFYDERKKERREAIGRNFSTIIIDKSLDY